ncbi:MAG: hypothetical protein GY742_06485 [Hyphomicrobiales bacterium]|nr:hypothetical protein [Hyphomicrobiales bacterium]
MQLIFVLIAIVAAVIYAGELPAVMQFPLPLIVAAIFTFVALYALRKA